MLGACWGRVGCIGGMMKKDVVELHAIREARASDEHK